MPRRAQLDQLEAELYDGRTWKQVAEGIYKSQAATTGRIQSVFLDLLHREASSSELAKLVASLPAANQTESLEIQILSGSEYRAQFPSLTAYVQSVFQTLTLTTPALKTVTEWTKKLERRPIVRTFRQAGG